MPPAEPIPNTGNEARILALFTGIGPLKTPQPDAKAWLGGDPSAHTGNNPAVLIKRVPGRAKGRATESLALLHPHIVRTRRWLASGDGFIYVVRDVVRGKNLRQSLAAPGGTRPSPELIRKLLLPVLDALAYAHAQNVVHGGISPDNIIISDTNQVMVTDWATADPQAPHHFALYKGEASVIGDVRAAGRILSAYLPMTGAFSNPQVRGRIEGVINRCDTLADLRVTVETLEKLAAAPTSPTAPAPKPPIPKAAPAANTAAPRPQQSPNDPNARNRLRDFDLPGDAGRPVPKTDGPSLFCDAVDKEVQVAVGGGGAAALMVTNDGTAPLVVRMIATQHAWMNVRPVELPLTLAPGAAAKVEFVISAARLSPGAYRSEIYFSANAGGQKAEDLRGGWFKHTCEIRVSVVETVFGQSDIAAANAGTNGVPAFPPNAPRLPAAPMGCGATLVLFPFVLALTAIKATYHTFFA